MTGRSRQDWASKGESWYCEAVESGRGAECSGWVGPGWVWRSRLGLVSHVVMIYVLAVTECSGRAGSVMVTRGGRVGVGSGGSCLGWEGRGGRCLEWSGTEEQVSPGVPVTDDREKVFGLENVSPNSYTTGVFHPAFKEKPLWQKHLVF